VKEELIKTFTNLDQALIFIFLTLLVFFYVERILRKFFSRLTVGNRLLEFGILTLIYVIVVPVLLTVALDLILTLEPFKKWVAIIALIAFDFISYNYLVK